jgi:hypothetical protein
MNGRTFQGAFGCILNIMSSIGYGMLVEILREAVEVECAMPAL